MIRQVAWYKGTNKGIKNAKLVEVLDHRAWGGTRATPDTYVVKYFYSNENPSQYHEKYIAMPYDLAPVGNFTLRKLKKYEEANPLEYRNEWISYYMLAREHIPGSLED